MKLQLIKFAQLILFFCFNEVLGNNDTSLYKQKFNLEGFDINYDFIESKLTHDFSNNWDFDGDSIIDQMSFVGVSGAGVYYYHLELKLSSEDSTRVYNDLFTSSPYYSNNIENDSLCGSVTPGFKIGDFNEDSKMDILYNIPWLYSSTKEKYGLKSKCIIIYYKEGEIKVEDW